jgi:cyclopropane fatty-acyl-phospholipid synthase-like methyltransferase
MESRDLDPDEVVDIYDELLKTYEKEWEQRGHRSLHFGYYDEEHTEPGEASMNTMRVLSEALDIDESDRILNIGCGAGEDSVWNARAYGAEVVGVNISETQLDIARKNAREHDVSELTTFTKDDFHDLDTVDDDSVDVVWGLEAISHSPDVSEVLEQATRVLRPEGRIGVTDMFTRALDLSSTDRDRIQTVNESLGVRVGNIDDFREALEAAGLTNIRVRDLTEGVEESAEQRYRFSRMAHPGYRLLGLVGRASETQIEALEANADIYRLVRDGTLGYYLITADMRQ